MPNTILTPQVISNELLRRFKNNLGFAGNVRHEYDERFAVGGAKIGDTLNLRTPVRFSASDGATLVAQDVTERSTPLTINKHKHVGFKFPMKDLTLSIDKFGERYLNSAAVALANVVDVDGLVLAYQSAAAYVGAPATIPASLKIYNQAGAMLDKAGCPYDGERSMVISPDMQVEIVDALKGLFQSSTQIKKQYEKGRMGTAAGFDWIMDQNVRTHTVGPLGGTPLVKGATQTGSSLLTDGWTAAEAARLKKGDILTLAGVYAVNPVSGDTLAHLRQFVVTANVSSTSGGEATVPIYPPIIVEGALKTCSASPDNGAVIKIFDHASTHANVLTPQGLAYHKDAFALAMVPFDLPKGVHFSARSLDKETGMSIAIVSDFDINEYEMVTRADIMYGWAAPIPEFACRVVS